MEDRQPFMTHFGKSCLEGIDAVKIAVNEDRDAGYSSPDTLFAKELTPSTMDASDGITVAKALFKKDIFTSRRVEGQ